MGGGTGNPVKKKKEKDRYPKKEHRASHGSKVNRLQKRSVPKDRILHMENIRKGFTQSGSSSRGTARSFQTRGQTWSHLENQIMHVGRIMFGKGDKGGGQVRIKDVLSGLKSDTERIFHLSKENLHESSHQLRTTNFQDGGQEGFYSLWGELRQKQRAFVPPTGGSYEEKADKKERERHHWKRRGEKRRKKPINQLSERSHPAILR